MPLARALRLCPDAVFLPHDRPVYEAASAEVVAALRSLPVAVEEWGWDEWFLGVDTDDPEALARRVQATVLEQTRLSCAVGIGQTRLQAKTATGWAKPGGIARLTRAEWLDRLGDEPVTALWGIGSRLAARLAELDVHTVRQLAFADTEALARAFGPRIGPSLRVSGLGGDESPIVDIPRRAKGRSKEETFERDLVDHDEVLAQLDRLATEVTQAVVADGRQVTHVGVKVRTASFFTRSKVGKLLDGPTTDPAVVAEKAREVFDRFEDVRGPIRLLGVRVVLDE
jgi:DNA polymerase-4